MDIYGELRTSALDRLRRLKEFLRASMVKYWRSKVDHFRNLLTTPELYPLRIDFKQRLMHFVRMSPESYRDSVFLDERTQSVGLDRYEIRLDDLLLASDCTPTLPKPGHYILHPTFCCSTLLARYFETLSFCFVLKEPMLLTQLALLAPHSVHGWNEAFDLAIRLLTRTYEPDTFVVIKPHEPCNVLASRLLEHNLQSSITFLWTPLRHFLLAVLKEEERRRWVRRRIPAAGNSTGCPALMNIEASSLKDAEAAAYLWLANMALSRQFSSGEYGSRVLILDGEKLVDTPEQSLRSVVSHAGLSLDQDQLGSMIDHPSAGRYSKDLSRPYDSSLRQQEIAELEKHWGPEADVGMQWASLRMPLLKLEGFAPVPMLEGDQQCRAL